MRIKPILWLVGAASLLPVCALRASADEAPRDILAVMRPACVSRQFGVYNAGGAGAPIEFHIYEGPVGHEKVVVERGDMFESNRPDHLYYVDACSRAGGKLHLVNTTFFVIPHRFAPSQELSFKWLKPKERSGPVLFSTFVESDGGANVLIVYPDGITGEAYIQILEDGGEGDGGNGFTFDTADSRGYMVITETVDSFSEKIHETHRSYWTGDRCAARSQQYEPYFVIAASLKSRNEAEQYVRQHKVWGVAAIRQTSHFASLQGGYYVVVVGTGASETKAAALARKFKKCGVVCYVKKAG